MKINEAYLENNRPFVLNIEKRAWISVSRMKRNGEPAAIGTLFWELVNPHKHKLYNFIQKSMNFSEDADDVFQETVLRAFKYFKSYKKEKSFNAWLYTIAHNEIKRHYKQSRRHVPIADMDRMKAPEKSGSQKLVREVYLFAESLKPRQREVFFLFYYNGFTIAEISRITGFKVGNIKFILNQARNSLKKIIGE